MEIKSGQTLNANFFDGIKAWAAMVDADPVGGILLYGVDAQSYQTNVGRVIGWRDMRDLVSVIGGPASNQNLL